MSRVYQRTEPVDQLVIGGESIVLYEDRFVRLGPLGTCLVTIAETPRTIEELAAALIDAFGASTQGSAADATRAAVADLLDQGVLQEADGD
jgi:hypothetical protein